MLTLLLVCSFSPKVQKYLLGSPCLIARESLFRSHKKPDKICRVFCGGGRGIRSCLLQSNLGQQFLCFAKAFGQPLKTTHRVVFLTLSFESLLLSTEKQNEQAKMLVRFVGGGRGIRTPVGFHPNGFQDRLVMTASIFLHLLQRLKV